MIAYDSYDMMNKIYRTTPEFQETRSDGQVTIPGPEAPSVGIHAQRRVYIMVQNST